MEQDYYRHFLISGRKHGGCEDTTAYVCVKEEQDPDAVFIREILYKGSLSDDWEERWPTEEENSFGDWADINGRIELPFGVGGPEIRLQAVELIDFRIEDGKFSTKVIIYPRAASVGSSQV